MFEANALDKITTYMAENRIIMALEAESKQRMALEASIVENNEINPNMANRPNSDEYHADFFDMVEEEGGAPTTQRECKHKIL